MAQGNIEIQFTPKGDKQLIAAIKQLDVVTKRLQGTTSVYEQGAKKAANTQKKLVHTVQNASPAYQKLTAQLLAQNKTWKQLGVSQKLATAAAKGNRVAIEKLRIAYKKATAQTRILGGAFSVIRSKLLIWSFGVGLASKLVLDQVNAFGIQEKSLEKLAVAFGQDGARALDEYSSRLQDVTTFGDEVTNSAMATIGMYGASVEATKKLTLGTMDLATTLDMDLVAAAQLVAKTIGSSTNALSRYGITIDATASQEEKAAQATKELERVFGGMAKAVARTTEGQIKQAKNALGDLAETIGGVLAPAVTLIAKGFTVVAKALQNPYVLGAAVTFTSIAVATGIAAAATTAFGGALTFATYEQIKLNIATKANPYILIGSAILGAATAVFAYYQGTKDLTAEQKKNAQAVKDAAEADKLAKEAKEKYDESVKKSTESLEKQLQLLKANTDIEKFAIENGIKLADVNKELFFEIAALNEERKKEEELTNSLINAYEGTTTARIRSIEAIIAEADARMMIQGLTAEEFEGYTALVNKLKELKNQQLKNNDVDKKTDDRFTQRLKNMRYSISFKKEELAKNGELNTIQGKLLLNEHKMTIAKNALNAIDKTTEEGKKRLIFIHTLMNNISIEEIELEKQKRDLIISNSFEIINAAQSVADAYISQKQATLDAEKATALAATESIRSERLRARAVEDINEQFAKKQEELNKKSQKAKRTQTVINNAAAIMEIWADKEGGTFFKIAMSALVAAQGQQQLKAIDAAKYEQGGLVGGRRHSQGGTMIEAERGEYVISRRGVDAAGLEALNRINAGAGGGGVNISINNPVLSKDVVEDDLIPQIKEAIRRGADIGVG